MVDKEPDMVIDHQRLEAIERHAEEMEARLARVERAIAPDAVPTTTPERPEASSRAPVVSYAAVASYASVAPTAASRPEAPAATVPSAPGISFEDLLGGRVLAWIGGAALLVGVAFFLAIAVSRGLLGEEARCVLAAVGALGLLAFGVRTQERGGSREAALSATGAAIAALDVVVTVATQSYDLLPVAAGVALALVIGAAATILAIRWRAQPVAVLGILGGLLAPALAGAPYDGATIVLLLAAAVPAAAVCIAQQWDRIALGAFAVTAPQLAIWLFDSPPVGGGIAALVAFGVIVVAQAVGFELRTKAPDLRPASAFLLTLNALALAGGGAAVLVNHGDAGLAHAWLAGLAVAHIAIGLSTDRMARVSRELGLLALSLGVVLADVALAATLSGVALPIVYAVGALAFAGLARALPATEADHLFVRAGLGGHVLLAVAHALTIDAPAAGLAGGEDAVDAAAAALVLGAITAASFVGARVDTLPRAMRVALDAVALAAVAWLAALTLDDVALASAWAAEGAALALVWRRSGDVVASVAAWLHLALAAIVALATVAPLSALADGLADPLGALIALGVLALALGRAAHAGLPVPQLGNDIEPVDLGCKVLWGAAVLTVLLLASMLVVTPFSVHAGQVALSALWGGTGVAALLAGLALDRSVIRRCALALLLLTIGKVFLIDLATLDSAARAGSFLALGVLLLGAAYAWQRQRPETRSDGD
jgi:uncharacterized membrane protein